MYEDFVMPRFCYSLFFFRFSFVTFVHNTIVYRHSHRIFFFLVNFNHHLELCELMMLVLISIEAVDLAR